MDYKKLHDSDPANYFSKMNEELAELQVAVHHYRDDKIDYDTLIGEIADVKLQTEKLMRWLSDFNQETYNSIFIHVDDELKLKRANLEKLIDELPETNC